MGINLDMTRIEYKKGYKYQLVGNYSMNTKIKPVDMVVTDFITLFTTGIIWIEKGYAWDGPSGPTFDTKNFMRGSLVHDALYQLMRQGLLPQSSRGEADQLLYDMIIEDGMSRLRAWWVYKGVSLFGFSSADRHNAKRVYIAPKGGK